MSSPLGCFVLALFIALIVAVAVTGAGQTYQNMTKDVSVQVCNPNCHWEIQTVLK